MLSEELNVSVDYFLKDAPNTYIGYWEAEEFKPLFEAMTPATRSALIPIMKSLLAVQNAAAATEYINVGKPGEIRRRKAIGPVKWQPVASYRVVSDCQACIGLTVLLFRR